MLAFYMDQHVRAEITRGLRQRGIDVLTALLKSAEEMRNNIEYIPSR